MTQSLFGIINQTTKKQLYTRIKVGKNKVKVNLLQFVDDTLFMCEQTFKMYWL